MARLRKEIEVKVRLGDEDVTITLREPSNQELNEFLSARYEISRKNRMRDNSLQARIDIFDLLLLKIENLEDADGQPITLERKELIPSSWKSDIVFRRWEENEIDIKN